MEAGDDGERSITGRKVVADCRKCEPMTAMKATQCVEIICFNRLVVKLFANWTSHGGIKAPKWEVLLRKICRVVRHC